MSHALQARISRLIGGLMAAGLVLALGGCATEAPTPEAPPDLAAGWQEHTSPLFSVGPGLAPGTTAWKVSGLLPRGTYRVIERQGERVRLLEGYRFEVDGAVNKEISLFLPTTRGDVEVLDEKYVLSSAPRP